MAPEYKHTAGNRVHAFMYLNVPELSTVSILLSTLKHQGHNSSV